MNRRTILVAFGLGAVAGGVPSWAQQKSRIWRVGLLTNRPATGVDAELQGAFVEGMRQLGYVEGRNLVIERRFSDGKSERLPGLAADLVRLKVDVIVASGAQPIAAARGGTSIIPIVGVSVPEGDVKSLARPGGNLTGLTSIVPELGHKHLEMLLSLGRKPARVSVLMDPDNAQHAEILKGVRAAAAGTGVGIVSVEARSAAELAPAFSAASREKAGAIIVSGGIFNGYATQIAELAVRHRMASISAFRVLPEGGGLMSYGRNLADSYRRAATFVDKIFKGAKPGDLPIEQPTTFELVINKKTAKALGITIPQSILVRADRVIE